MSEKVLMKGNEAIAEAAIRAGCLHFFGYPITPQTEVAAYMAKRMPKIGGVYMQAESEVAAINMIYGAAAAGVRCMTSSSSPGIALKAEGLSYLIGSDLPAVIINVQRGGPGLGGIQPSQADYNLATKGSGHGDGHMIVIAPSSVQEMVNCTADAFDMADLYRVPVMILADGMLGQMMEPVEFGEKAAGRKLPAKDWAADGKKKAKRNIINSLLIDPAVLEQSNLDRFARYAEIEAKEALYDTYLCEDAEYIVTAYGATARIAKNAINAARKDGIKVGLIRPITLWPFPKAAYQSVVSQAKAFLTVEMSMGQMVDDVKLAVACQKPVHFFGRTGGVIPTPAEILAEIKKIAGGEK